MYRRNPHTETVRSDEFGAVEPLKQIGRYQIEKQIGKGGYGLVYLAFDSRLDRRVAIKIPSSARAAKPADFQAQLREARTAANLDHAHIVPVYDVGSCRESPFYVVSKYIDGTDLAASISTRRLPCREVAELIAVIAEALHCAHKSGIVHRDVKPGNILIDRSGTPFVTDFGVALNEQTLGKGPKYVGTPAYMSPEQARGEGHRVDGRSDVFSLGVVMYELLIGVPPFRADSRSELLEQITTYEPRPLRQQDDGIPKELERICFKALAKRASERYMTAKDLAEDLHHYLATTSGMLAPSEAETMVPPEDSGHTALSGRSSSRSSGRSSGGSPAMRSAIMTPTASDQDTDRLRIVPKGLRSFDEHDADFFLELLPGPRDRDGLPDSVRFWKARIEEIDSDKTFSVGLIYGPSGCGKSSLIKAGLLPRVADHVSSIYVEATAAGAESQLLGKLRKLYPFIPDDLNLKETLTLLRQERAATPGEKILIVLDQLEQWLHAWNGEGNAELIEALRQCDGSGVQCLVLVRDDFWMAMTRFMRCLEIRLVEGDNSAAVDLFQPRHAERILAAFGHAFGDLPEHSSDATSHQRAFLRQAVEGLAEDGKVICVRLALLAEMMKGKTWEPATLQKGGGTSGIGVTFLEETFEVSTAPPEHRYHQKAARAVLAALLPESGTNIKGHMRSYEELRKISGAVARAEDFDNLMHMLDSELRLITPADPIGVAAITDDSNEPVPASEGASVEPDSAPSSARKHYQLTHDYLVPSLRQWLTRKQRETYRGRAALRLADRSAAWNAKPENRQLPSWFEYVTIRALTDRSAWKESQHRMMVRARDFHSIRALLAAGVLALGIMAGLSIWNLTKEQRRIDYSNSLVTRLVGAEITQVPNVVREIHQYRQWVDPTLRHQYQQVLDGSAEKLHLSLALLPVDRSQIDYLTQQLFDLEPDAIAVVRSALVPYGDQVKERLWDAVREPRQTAARRFHGACSLASLDHQDPRWNKVAPQVAQWLVTNLNQSPRDFDIYVDLLAPVRRALVPALSRIVTDRSRSESERESATNVLVEYAVDQPQILTDVLIDAPSSKFDLVLDILESDPDSAAEELNGRLWNSTANAGGEQMSEANARRKAHAAIALLRLGRPESVWPLLRASRDPLARSFFIDLARPMGVDPGMLIKQLARESDVAVRQSIVLCLGEYERDSLHQHASLDRSSHTRLVEKLLHDFRTQEDAGLHAATRWLLRSWGYMSSVAEIEQELRGNDANSTTHLTENQGWYVNTQSQTMVVLDAPSALVHPARPAPSENNAGSCEPMDNRTMRHRFALAACEVTREQFDQFMALKVQTNVGRYSLTQDSPQIAVTWYGAAAYCNWLSAEEGIPEEHWCYTTNDDSAFAEGMSIKPNFLTLQGYRLPLEAEWEYACRAGTQSSRYYGNAESLLAKYAWHQDNSDNHAWPVAMLKPNDFGLFDMHGNVWEWCQERYRNQRDSAEVADRDLFRGDHRDGSETRTGKLSDPVLDIDARILRGGGFSDQPGLVTSRESDQLIPTYRSLLLGFRPARTMP